MKTIAVVIKHPGRDDPSDVRVDLYSVPDETDPQELREYCQRRMLGPFQVLYVVEKVCAVPLELTHKTVLAPATGGQP